MQIHVDIIKQHSFEDNLTQKRIVINTVFWDSFLVESENDCNERNGHNARKLEFNIVSLLYMYSSIECISETSDWYCEARTGAQNLPFCHLRRSTRILLV